MANELIGLGRCICGSEKAKVSLSDKTKLAYLTCSACSLQIFARSGRSDEAIRRMLNAPAAPAAPKPEPKAAPAKVEAGGDDWAPF